jgi:hypothetical protein
LVDADRPSGLSFLRLSGDLAVGLRSCAPPGRPVARAGDGGSTCMLLISCSCKGATLGRCTRLLLLLLLLLLPTDAAAAPRCLRLPLSCRL